MRNAVWGLLLLSGLATAGLATHNATMMGTKFCGCDVAAPCSDCCSPAHCQCKPKDPTAAMNIAGPR